MFIVTCEFCGKKFDDADGSDPNKRLQGHQATHCPNKNKEMKVEKKVESKKTVRPGDRKERIPFGGPQRKLTCPDDKNFHHHIFNDNWRKDPMRIQRAVDAGYEVVPSTKDALPVGTNEDGSGIRGVLMRIPSKFYEEDQAAKQVELDKIDEQIKSGTFKQEANDNRYSPDGIRIWEDNQGN